MGGKQRLAKEIVDLIEPWKYPRFYDVCCGSGGIALEALSRGCAVTMIDSGPWGAWWAHLPWFDLEIFDQVVASMPSEKEIKPWLEALATQTPDELWPYHFLLLQAGSFGSKPVDMSRVSWSHPGFRKSDGTSQHATLVPSVGVMRSRLVGCLNRRDLIEAHWIEAERFVFEQGSLVYVDPPYSRATDYNGHCVDLDRLAPHCDVFVSECVPLGDLALQLNHSSKRRFSGPKKSREEWLTLVRREACNDTGG